MTHTQAATVRGVGVGRGAAVGTVVWVRSQVEVAADYHPQHQGEPVPANTFGEVTAEAFDAVAHRLEEQAARADGALGQVLAATAQMAADPELRSQTLRKIEAGSMPVAAVNEAVGTFVEMFEQAGGLLAERIVDLHSVREQVIAHIAGIKELGIPDLVGPSVVVAEDLAPAQTASMNMDYVVAIVTRLGGPTSHTAIIAGQLGIPCLVQVEQLDQLTDGAQVVVDAAAGRVVMDPDAELLQAVELRAAAARKLAANTSAGATSDGHRVQLLGNIGGVADVVSVQAVAAEGVGLLRTEFLFLDQKQAPTLEQQRDAYSAVIAAMQETRGKVVVRTLDAGADKPLAFAQHHDEENPALGVRGYRLKRRNPELLATQLQALAQAGGDTGGEADGLWVMAPMISTAAEAREFAAAAREVGLGTVGVMVEVPAAAINAEQILAEVDFVSLGTNDLAQYTMASDRLAGELADLLDHWQPAVLDLVARTAAAGTKLGKPVGVCGESASDPLMALVLTGMGITSLSMSGGAIPAVRHILAHTTLATCQQAAEVALAATDPDAAKAAVLELVDPQIRVELALQ